MDLRKLKTLIDLVSDSNVSELEITEAEGTVRIVKSAPAPVAMVTQMAAPAAVAVAAPASPTPTSCRARRFSIAKAAPAKASNDGNGSICQATFAVSNWITSAPLRSLSR